MILRRSVRRKPVTPRQRATRVSPEDDQITGPELVLRASYFPASWWS